MMILSTRSPHIVDSYEVTEKKDGLRVLLLRLSRGEGDHIVTRWLLVSRLDS